MAFFNCAKQSYYHLLLGTFSRVCSLVAEMWSRADMSVSQMLKCRVFFTNCCLVMAPVEMIACMKDWVLWRNIRANAIYHGTWWWWCLVTYLIFILNSWQGWSKGVVIVNGFNLGRYWHVGPQRTLYLPAPLLKKGRNEVRCWRGLLVLYIDRFSSAVC